MHIEIDRVLVRLTETTLRELLKGIDELRANRPNQKTALFKSDFETSRFLIDMNVPNRIQQSLDYKLVPLEGGRDEKVGPRTPNGFGHVRRY